MERNYGSEIDDLKAQLEQIKKAIIHNRLLKTTPHAPADGKDVLDSGGRDQLSAIQAQLVDYTDEYHESGAIAYAGTFCSGDDESTRQSMWASVIKTDDLLKLNEQQVVERVLASVGNSQRLGILLALLKKPMTVSELVNTLGANSTGQIYHHLKPLVLADIIHEEKGIYAVIPYRVQGIIMLLAGVNDLIDKRYTSGTWEEESE